MKIINRKCNKLEVMKTESVLLELEGNTQSEQLMKIKEELWEVQQAIINYKYKTGEKEEILKELFDLRQTIETMMRLFFNTQEIKDYAPKHVKKMIKEFGGTKLCLTVESTKKRN